jgi:hypothetical protein
LEADGAGADVFVPEDWPPVLVVPDEGFVAVPVVFDGTAGTLPVDVFEPVVAA